MTENNDSAAVKAVVNIVNENGRELEVRSALDIKPSLFKAGLDRRKKNRDALIDHIRDALVEGTDFGRIHVMPKDRCPDGAFCANAYHFSKPSLWKAGAEKIAGILGLRVTWPTLRLYEDRIIRGDNVTQILLRCELLNSDGVIIAEGIGGRDVGDDLNKALKMAKKSGQIDAVLNVGGLSEVFTQDLEDMDPEKLAGQRDPFQPGEERVESAIPRNAKPLSSHCPIGKDWKGVPWAEVDAGFLSWIIEKIDDKPDLRDRALKELESRSVETDEAGERRRDDRLAGTKKKIQDYARELATAKNLDQILVIKEELPEDFEPGLRAFIAEREAELGPQ
jgi:hypothetical protein